jgi:hypothetical protein
MLHTYPNQRHAAVWADTCLWQGRDDIPTNYGAVLNILSIIRAVISSAVEAELSALFINAKTTVSMRHTLEELSHPQPPTPMQTDNKTAHDLLTKKICQRHKRRWTCVSTGYDVAKLRDNSDITGDRAHKTWQISSPSTTRQVTTCHQTHFPDTAQGPIVHKTIPTATGLETHREIYHKAIGHNKLLHKVIREESTPKTKVQDQNHQHSHSKKCLNIPTARVY